MPRCRAYALRSRGGFKVENDLLGGVGLQKQFDQEGLQGGVVEFVVAVVELMGIEPTTS